VITDGAVSSISECLTLVNRHSDTTRVFTFGIGQGASSDLVKGLAAAGKGFAEFVLNSETVPLQEVSMRQIKRLELQYFVLTILVLYRRL
jgi:hypothetical protein